MSRGKRLRRKAASSVRNPRRCVREDDENTAPRGGDSIFSCCVEKGAGSNKATWDLPRDEYDYIVEKLVIKRVPIALFATTHDVCKSDKVESKKNTKVSSPVSDSKKMHPAVQAVDSSLFYTTLNSTGPPGFPTRPSNKTLRFSRTEDVFDDDNALASTSGYNDHLTNRLRGAELLNRFTALHPNLKESERAPKDPCPLNATRSRRSLAEEISEIAATKESHGLHDRRSRNGLGTTDNVHAGQPGTSRELPTAVSAAEKIPTRDKAEEIPSRYRTGSSSCFPFSWRSENRDKEAATRATRPEDSVADKNSSGPAKNQNFIIAPVQVQYTSPNFENMRKIMREEGNRIDAASGNRRKSNYEALGKEIKRGPVEESDTDGNSEATEEPSLDNLAGTTLRWKIIIKHHPPDASATSGTSKINSRPMLSKGHNS